MIILSILILSVPTTSELIAERNGEAPEHKKTSTTVRAFLMIVCAGVATGIVQTDLHLWPLTLTYLKCLLLSFAIFFASFDYLFNLIFHKKTKVWYSYLSKSPIDTLFSKVDWRIRMALKAIIFTASLIWFLI